MISFAPFCLRITLDSCHSHHASIAVDRRCYLDAKRKFARHLSKTTFSCIAHFQRFKSGARSNAGIRSAALHIQRPRTGLCFIRFLPFILCKNILNPRLIPRFYSIHPASSYQQSTFVWHRLCSPFRSCVDITRHARHCSSPLQSPRVSFDDAQDHSADCHGYKTIHIAELAVPHEALDANADCRFADRRRD